MLSASLLPVALAVVALSHSARAVCAPGDIAIGQETVMFTDMIGTHVLSEGIAVSNNCDVLAKTNFDENTDQVCVGEWDGAISVSCTSGLPTSVRGSQPGVSYTCVPTNDTSCNSGSTGTVGVAYQVIACCSGDD